jgi:hypothetical protein
MHLFSVYTCSIVLLALSACGPKASQPTDTAAEPEEISSSEASTETPQDLFWNHLTTLCGNAYRGAMTSDDAVDVELAGQTMVMHVRHCSENRIEIPFHVGENRSRTWILTRHKNGLQLQHDHRHEDGSEDTVTLYGGRTTDGGSQGVQSFPADEYSKELFTANGLDASLANTWSLEIEPGKRFSYILRRPERHFQADFDLSVTVPEPPPPWGHSPYRNP